MVAVSISCVSGLMRSKVTAAPNGAQQGRQHDDDPDQDQKDDDRVGNHVAHPLDAVEKPLHRGLRRWRCLIHVWPSLTEASQGPSRRTRWRIGVRQAAFLEVFDRSSAGAIQGNPQSNLGETAGSVFPLQMPGRRLWA